MERAGMDGQIHQQQGPIYSPEPSLIGRGETVIHLYEGPIHMPASLARPIERAPSRAERSFDIALATMLIIATLPLMLICALAIFAGDRGPVLFRQRRIGLKGEEFTCLKFRTMKLAADEAIREVLRRDPEARREWEAVRKLSHDPRITPIGHFLRRYSLDELPQFFNVLGGQMSIVGPRPIVAAEIDRYGPRFADYCSVKPGLTGLWQVSGLHSTTYGERVRFDSQYARMKSVRGDLVILFRTIPVVLFGSNE